MLLACGHVFHHACVVKKLRERWPHARITFGFMSCPLCKKRMEHPALAAELAPCVSLLEDVRGKALQRLEFEGLKKDPDVAAPAGRYFNRPADYAMDKFAYYPCYQCKVWCALARVPSAWLTRRACVRAAAVLWRAAAVRRGRAEPAVRPKGPHLRLVCGRRACGHLRQARQGLRVCVRFL